MHLRWLHFISLAMLTSLPAAGQQKRPDPLAGEFKVLFDEYSSADRDYQAPLMATKTPEEFQRVHLDPARDPRRAFLPRFASLAARADGTEVGRQALSWVAYSALRIGDARTASRAFVDLARKYADDPETAYAIRYLGMGFPGLNTDPKRDILRDIVKYAVASQVVEQALFTLGEMALDNRSCSNAIRAEAKEAFTRIRDDYPASALVLKVDRALFELEHLQDGCSAPDFDASDETGKRFKLSDYRGKVVLLDFWGFWCGPCQQILPSLKRIANRFKAEPFAILGIDSDGDLPRFQRMLKERDISWRQAFEGMYYGPIAVSWNVRGWPTVYLVDANGKIRFRGHGMKEVESVCATLIEEAKQKKE